MLERFRAALAPLEALKAAGAYTYSLETSSACGATMVVEGRERINFISNSYLGLSTHPRVLEAIHGALAEYGIGMGGSPLACGSSTLHRRLAARIAATFDKEAALVFTTGYQALAGSIQVLLQTGDTAIVDSLAHRSIIDGTILSGAKRRTFVHNDADDLREVLSTAPRDRTRVVIVDSVYSMDGDIADLPGLHAACREHGAILLADEAHSLGIIGPQGRGLMDHFGLPGAVDVVSGTFSKFAGSIGGFAAADHDTIEYMRHAASPFVFSASLPAPLVAGVLAAFDLLAEDPGLRERLWENVRYLTDGLRGLGFDLGLSATPVIPVMVRDQERTMAMNRRLLDEGVYASPVIHPGVPPRLSRVRLGVMATHTRAHLDRALDVFGRVGREVGLI
jgi:glycine C-acetyltransferase